MDLISFDKWLNETEELAHRLNDLKSQGSKATPPIDYSKELRLDYIARVKAEQNQIAKELGHKLAYWDSPYNTITFCIYCGQQINIERDTFGPTNQFYRGDPPCSRRNAPYPKIKPIRPLDRL